MHWLKSYGVFLLTIFLLIIYVNASAQESKTSKGNIQHSAFNIPNSLAGSDINERRDSIRYYPYNKNRVKWVAAANIAGYSGTMAALYSTWYKNYPQSS
ncbi:MAG: hypothetical protein EOO01_22435, partial [Chitinophagaceae bacterium]